MPIVSVALNDRILREMDMLKVSMGFSGRSELIRAGIRSLIREEQERLAMVGDVHALLLLGHDEGSEGVVTQVKHKFDKLVATHIHSKLGRGKCLEIFLLGGEAKKVGAMMLEFRASRKMDLIRLIPV